MRKLCSLSLPACAGLLLAIVLLGQQPRAAPGTNPATDSRFCADANGDGRLDIADALTVLNFLFTGEGTPYCVAQGVSIDGLSSRIESLTARMEIMEALTSRAGLIATGEFVGDGSNNHRIDTGLGGHLKYLRIWLDCEQARCGREDFIFNVAKTDFMPEGYGEEINDLRLDGSAFIVGPQVVNEAGRRYAWMAIATATKN